jgi:hypothetical protein
MTPPRVSVIVEWENIELAGASQAARMMAQLREEVAAQPDAVEVLLCVAGDAAELSGGDHIDLPAGWRIVPVGEAHYYELKNRGARLAQGEVVVFLDSDAVPETGWLAALLAPFSDPAVQVVAGHTCIEPASFVAKAFALWWFFPLRDERSGPGTPVRSFFANNLAFRRALLLEHPFVSPEGTARGACILLATRLADAGVRMVSAPDAIATHPPPNGWRHMVMRAVVQGRDRVLRDPPEDRRVTGAYLRLARHTARSVWRSVMDGSKVQLPLLQRPAAAMLGCLYYTGYFVGELAAHLGVERVARLRV